MNATHQILTYENDFNLIDDDFKTIERNSEPLINTFKDNQSNEHIKIGSNSDEKVKTFKYLGSLLTNQNSIHKEIKCRLKAGNSCYCSIQTLSSRLLSNNLKIKIYIKQ